MTLAELKERGVTRVRRMEWAYPHQYVELVQLEDGSWSEFGTLYTAVDENALAQPSAHEVLVASFGAYDDRWEPYPRP